MPVLFLDEAKKLTGFDWGRYTYRHWADRVEFRRYPEFAAGPLWLADYITATRAEVRVPTAVEVAARPVPKPWDEIAIVQHDGNGRLHLPSGVDSDFNVLVGGDEALARLSGGSPAWRGAPEQLVAAAPLV